jgi:VanZ family protein
MKMNWNSAAWRQGAFGASALVILVLSLISIGPEMPTTGWDKTNHLLGFGVLAVLGLRAWPRRPMRVALGLMVFGALIEGLQALTTDRTAEWGDWLADVLGLLLGAALLALATRVVGLSRHRD